MNLNLEQLRVLVETACRVEAYHSSGGEAIEVDFTGWEDEGADNTPYAIGLGGDTLSIKDKAHVATIVENTDGIRLVDHPFTLVCYQKMDLKDTLRREGL